MSTNHSKLIFALLLVLSAAYSAPRAEYVKEYNPWPVIVNGEAVELPFLGGIDDPKPWVADLDGDGLDDLLIGSVSGKVLFMKNSGTMKDINGLSVPIFLPAQERLGGIAAGSWFTLADIDGDNDLDFFCDAPPSGVRFYENQSVGGDIDLVLADTAFQGLVAGYNSTPRFVDLDSDHDLDFFFGGLTGGLVFYRNDGDSINPSFNFVTEMYDSIVAIPGGLSQSAGERHGFSNICFVDIDDDHDLDLFWGDVFNFDIYHFANLGDSAVSDLTWQTDSYLGINTSGFNHPVFADFDKDNDYDLLVGVANAADLDNLHLYENAGDSQFTVLIKRTENLIDMLDFGSNSVPAAGDIDNDGDIDLLVGAVDGHLFLLKNIGTPFDPIFELTDSSFQGIDVGYNAAPILYDWDGDNDLDLLIGTQLGRIEYWRNDGDVSNFVAVLETNQLGGIKVDQLAIPWVADLNDDNRPDLIVGEWDFNSHANVLLYPNIGTSNAPELAAEPIKLLRDTLREFTVPRFYDADGDSRLDLYLGENLEGLTLYKNISDAGQFPDSTTLALQPDSLFGSDDGGHCAILFVDIDSDNDDDLFSGEREGGLNFYRHAGGCCLGFRGNVNADPDDKVNITDITYLTSYLFGVPTGPAPLCWLEASANGDPENKVNITDITYLVTYLFGVPAGPAPPACP